MRAAVLSSFSGIAPALRGGAMAVLRTAWIALSVVLAALAGCGDDDCPQLSRCDVRERGCQRAVIETMACLRGGGSGELPAVRVISEAEFIDRINSYASDDEDEARQAEREAEYALWSRGLSLFELAPAEYAIDDAVVDSATETAAAYFHAEREIVIIDRGKSLADENAIELFAHEIVHALQDQDLDLSAYEERWSTSFDSSLALRALIEGEAVHYEILAAVQLAGRSPSELDWERLYAEWRSETLAAAEADAAPVALADVRFPYAFGGGFVSQHWLARGRAGIDALFDDPPRTSSQVLFGSSPDELAAEQETLAAHAVPALGEPFVETAATALGAWVARMYAARAIAEVGLRTRPAQELAADVFSVQHDAASDVLVAAWRARTREGASAVDWPALERDTLIRQTDASEREVYTIGADPELPADAHMLAWREPAEPEEERDPQTASAAWRLPLGLGRYRACAPRRPGL